VAKAAWMACSSVFENDGTALVLLLSWFTDVSGPLMRTFALLG